MGRLYKGLFVGGVEKGGTHYQYVRPGGKHGAGGILINSAVNGNQKGKPPFFPDPGKLFNLFQTFPYHFLAAETGINGHYQYQIKTGKQFFE
jgi:hypothetical protein